MNVYELIEKVNGEIVNGRARVRIDNKYIIVGRVTPEGMVMTPDGKTLVDEQSTPAPKRARKAKVEDDADADSIGSSE